MAPALHSSATPNEIIGKETSKLQATAMPSRLVCHGKAVPTCHGIPVATSRLAMCLAVKVRQIDSSAPICYNFSMQNQATMCLVENIYALKIKVNDEENRIPPCEL